MKRSARIETVVGLFAVFGMLLLVGIFFVLLSKEYAFEGRFDLVAIFDDVSGLKPGAAVQLAGIDVGSVASVQFNEQNKAEVVLEIRDQFKKRIYKDARASLSTMGLLGDKIIIITSGSREAGPINEGAIIATAEYMQIGDILDELRPALDNITSIVEHVSGFVTSLNAPVEELEKVLQSAAQIAEQINAGTGTAGLFVKDPQLYSKLVTLIEDADKTVRELEDVVENMRIAANDLPEMAGTARKTLANAQQGASDFSELAASGKEIAANAKTAAEGLPDLIAKANRAAADLETIMKDVKSASGELPDLIATGREGIEEGIDVVDAARKSPLVRRYLGDETVQRPVVPALRDTNYSEGK